MTEFAALAGVMLGPGLEERRESAALRETIASVIRSKAFSPVFQPVQDLRTGATVGYEGLTRFADGTRPDRRFAEAETVGLAVELELACIERIVEVAEDLTDHHWLSINVSPAVVVNAGRLGAILERAGRPIVLELTEHAAVSDYVALRAAIAGLGDRVRFAIDDAGAGFASFRHIVELAPHFVKLDIGLVRSIERDPARQALVAGMEYFALKTGCTLIAEGIETEPERDALRTLDIKFGQGYLLGRPLPVAA
jgi:EAL domain-containing protein (putative c-di-GMP-specific phosphodiesterase class I)